MRLWHWKLIPVLPRQQLLGQWRECCLIAKNIAEEGTPNHILVDPVMQYNDSEFIMYCKRVAGEMSARGYRVNPDSLTRYIAPVGEQRWKTNLAFSSEPLFRNWHNDQYFWQCYYNLQEKHDRGGIANDEWQKIEELTDQMRKE